MTPIPPPTFQSRFATILALPGHKKPDDLRPYLDEVAAAGCTGVYLQCDVLRDEGPSPLVYSEFHDNWRLLNIFDLIIGPESGRYRQYVRDIGALCRERSLALSAQCWVPMLSNEVLAYLKVHRPDAIGQGQGHMISNAPTICSCADGDGLNLLAEAVNVLCESAGGLFTLGVGIKDNSCLICDHTCPHANGTGEAEHAAHVYGAITRTLKESHPETRLVVYPWFWPEPYEAAILRELEGEGVLILTKAQRGAIPQSPPLPNEPLFDCSLAADTLGPDIQRWFERVGAERVMDMSPLHASIDNLMLSAAPLPGRKWRHLERLRSAGVRHVMDFECSAPGHGSTFDLLTMINDAPIIHDENHFYNLFSARFTSHPEAQAALIKAWHLFDEGYANLPLAAAQPDVRLWSGRFGFAWPLCITTPLLPAMFGGDRGHEIHWFSPYNLITPATAPVLEKAFTAVVTIWRRSVESFREAEHAGLHAKAREDAVAAQSHLLAAESALNWIHAMIHAAAFDTSALRENLERERALANAFDLLWTAHPWVFDNSCWHPVRTVRSQRHIYPEDRPLPSNAQELMARKRNLMKDLFLQTTP